MKGEIERLNDVISKTKVQEMSIIDQFNNRLMIENKIRDLEIDNKGLRDDRQRVEIDYRVLLERHNELKKHAEVTDKELEFLKNRQSDEVSTIESRLDKMSKEMDSLQKDNNTLRVNEARLRQELLNLEKQRDTYQEKYQDYKTKNNFLNNKLTEVYYFNSD
jgi:chromosome segregation ATPase